MRPNSLVPHHLHGADPSYFVVAGVVFTVLTGEAGGGSGCGRAWAVCARSRMGCDGVLTRGQQRAESGR